MSATIWSNAAAIRFRRRSTNGQRGGIAGQEQVYAGYRRRRVRHQQWPHRGEVDGDAHVAPEQAARDALKDSILAKSGLHMLRLRTVESGIMAKIAGFLDAWREPAAA